MVADVTETRNVIPNSKLEFKTSMTIKSYVYTVFSRFEFKIILFTYFCLNNQ